jgi:Rieske 2Fe-2S family protein
MKPRTSRGQRTLDRGYFSSADIWRIEQERVFRTSWLLAGHVSDLPESGSYILFESGHDSVIVLRDGTGCLRAHHNVCRHRGTRLCDAPRGQLGKTLRCAYHAWSYDLDGSLQTAPHMNEVAGFDKAQWGLKPAALAEWRGFVFVNLAPAPMPLTEALPLAGRFEHWPLETLRSVHQTVYDVEANWKLLFHNYSECYHCPAVHPQLNRLTPFRNSENDLEEGPMLGGPMLLNNPQGSMTTGGERCAPPFAQLTAGERARVYYYTFFPSAFLSLHPDYVLVHRVQPMAIGRTRVVCDWYFDDTASRQSGFEPSPAISFWDLTNRQDWALCENAFKGVASSAWEPGPYSELESQLAAFDRHYLRLMC